MEGTEMIPFTERRVDDAFGSCTQHSIPLSVLSKSCPFTRTILQPQPHHQLVSLVAVIWRTRRVRSKDRETHQDFINDPVFGAEAFKVDDTKLILVLYQTQLH